MRTALITGLVFFATLTAHAESVQNDPSYKSANCRGYSDVNKNPDGTAPSFVLGSSAPDGQPVDVSFETCAREAVLAIISGSSNDGPVILVSDAGVIEFREPGTSEFAKVCRYAVEAGVTVDPEIVRYNNSTPDGAAFDYEKIKVEAAKIVRLSCNEVS